MQWFQPYSLLLHSYVIRLANQIVHRQEQFTARQEQFTARQEQFTARQEQFTARQKQFTASQEQFTARQERAGQQKAVWWLSKLLKGSMYQMHDSIFKVLGCSLTDDCQLVRHQTDSIKTQYKHSFLVMHWIIKIKFGEDLQNRQLTNPIRRVHKINLIKKYRKCIHTNWCREISNKDESTYFFRVW